MEIRVEGSNSQVTNNPWTGLITVGAVVNCVVTGNLVASAITTVADNLIVNNLVQV